MSKQRFSRREAVDVVAKTPRMNTFMSFRCASAEIPVRGCKAHASARPVQWEDGKAFAGKRARDGD